MLPVETGRNGREASWLEAIGEDVDFRLPLEPIFIIIGSVFLGVGFLGSLLTFEAKVLIVDMFLLFWIFLHLCIKFLSWLWLQAYLFTRFFS